jgi:hypothetical protein
MELSDGAREMVGLCDGATVLEDLLLLPFLPALPHHELSILWDDLWLCCLTSYFFVCFPFPFPSHEGMEEGALDGAPEGILESEGIWLRDGADDGAGLKEGAEEIDGAALGV